MSNRLVELMKLGQSIWFDNIQRGMLNSGELQRMVEEDDLRGVTSNPTIFEKAITGSGDYDSQLRSLINSGASVEEIYEGLVIDDITRAADILKPVYDRTRGVDGYISLEVNPQLAYQTAATIDEAKRLFEKVGRKNVMIKIPASAEGIPAIEESIYRGININITMIFSIENYKQVAEAYIRGLERRAEEGKPVNGIASVASFFVSRVDTLVDSELEKMAEHARTEKQRTTILELRGRAALANAKIAYEEYKAIFHGARFQALLAEGAMVQRPLWASTGTKNPSYPDLLYVDNLIGPETVNTIPPATYKAFKDHGIVALTLELDVDKSREDIAQLAEVGIDMKMVTDKLQKDGLEAFVKSFDSLEESIRAKRASILSGINERLSANPGSYGQLVNDTLKDADKNHASARIWKKDASLWKTEPDQQKIIANALGWLNVIETMRAGAKDLKDFAQSIRQSGEFTHVMVCGMGGSSLCPEVLRQTFGPQAGYPELLVLDSTDPDQITLFRNQIEVNKTLFIIASKSGTTTEPLTFYKYWFDEVSKSSATPGANFVAITDPGTIMEKLAAEKGFRKTFLNPADIGGRYSALSYFGLVPAALMGLDVDEILERAERIKDSCSSVVPAAENPGVRLGAIIGACASAGRDKLTLVSEGKLASLGLWIEQLIAESTGKEGKGILPVVGEPLGTPSVYGTDRLFVHIALNGAEEEGQSQLAALEQAGHPIVHLKLNDVYDLAEQFFLWEFATAVAGWRIGINPFDQPNVQEAKDATKSLLEEFKKSGQLPGQNTIATDGTLTLFSMEQPAAGSFSLEGALSEFIGQARPGDYIALLDFVEETPEHEAVIESIRKTLRDSTSCATTAGYGPRYLHSTGQLHKGGPENGIFLQLTAPDKTDQPVPGEPYTFSVLKDAQALGDYLSLTRRGRRALRIDLGHDSAAGLQRLKTLIDEISEEMVSNPAGVGSRGIGV
jgi:transaldolase/glucose-6-phosphate isomerase